MDDINSDQKPVRLFYWSVPAAEEEPHHHDELPMSEERQTTAAPTLEQLAAFMAEQKLVRLVYCSGADRIEMERHPSAFRAEAKEEPRHDADRCACSHSLSTEHNEAGCYFGCSVALCNETKE